MITLKAAYKAMGCGKLLSAPGANPKTVKGEKESGIHTAILHLAPGEMSGYQVCAHASPGCLKGCLHTAGNKAYYDHKTRARIAKTRAFKEQPGMFLWVLERELMTRLGWAAKRGLKLAVRLNGTSDVNWDEEATAMVERLVEAGIILYDYTKDPAQTRSTLRSVVYSRSEVNHKRVAAMLDRGVSVAVVVEGCGISAHPKPLPETMWGYPVVDGDVHDRTFEHPRGVVIALRAKGDARGDTSGFVVDPAGNPLTGTPVALTVSAAA